MRIKKTCTNVFVKKCKNLYISLPYINVLTIRKETYMYIKNMFLKMMKSLKLIMNVSISCDKIKFI